MSGSKGQLTLVPEKPPQTQHVRVSVDELLAKTKLTGPPPDYAFVQSVRTWGILVPLLVERNAKGWKLLAGKRRLRAVQIIREGEVPEGTTSEDWQEQWSTVPAEQVENDGWREQAAGVVENEQRSDNFSDLVDMLEELEKAGLSEREITDQTLVVAARIRRAMRVTKLLPVLRKAFRDGKITQGVAEAAAKCTLEQQEKLAAIYKSEEQLTASDVREVRKADARSATAALEGLGEDDLGNWWIDEVKRKLTECLAIVPEGEGLRDDLTTILNGLEG